jgi:dTDP-4-amino-4,6-dideoxygalactose transaminase
MMQWSSMHSGLDTVEEYWTWDVIEQAYERANEGSLAEFRVDFSRFIGVDPDWVYAMPSGHQGLEWLLRARRDSRRCVMVPAFNCRVVQEAVIAADFQAKLYDFTPRPGEFDWTRVIESMGPDVGALIVTHYFGVAVDFRPVRDYCAAQGIAIIEDCAHTLGGTIAGRYAGTLGDAAIFSFNYDKPISLGWGGLAVINNPCAFDKTAPVNYQTPSVTEEMYLLQRFVAAMTQRRNSIQIENRLVTRILRSARLLKTGRFFKDPGISIGAVQAELGRWCLARYPDVQRQRRANAQTIVAGVTQPTWPLGAEVEPAWIKQKVLMQDEQCLSRAAARLQRYGVRAGNFNWSTLIEGRERSKCYQARQASRKWMDIPVHQNMTREAMTLLLNTLNSVE